MEGEGVCGGGTETRVYQTTIPFFKEVILMADACDACGYRNAEVKGGGGVPELGRRLVLKVTTPGDLRRDVIKAEIEEKVETQQLRLKRAPEDGDVDCKQQ